MNKIKIAFALLILSFVGILVLFLLMTPAPRSSLNRPINPTTLPPPPNGLPPILSTMETIAEGLVPSQPLATAATGELPVTVTLPATSRTFTETEVPPVIKDIVAFENSFGRNIFQEKIELQTPTVLAEQYENPDTDGLVVLRWDEIPLASSYDMDVNNELTNSVKPPHKLDNLNDGQYIVRVIARNVKGNSKWSNPLNFEVNRPKIPKAAKRESLRLNIQGILKKGSKFQALIDDKIYTEGDDLAGGRISLIELERLLLIKDGNDYEFSLKMREAE
ncbi:MAG: fibronectin type III domain-containing protein [Candidatus Wallbacteria bacterium]|nr:fibronectin type III domain-containing protein [Candidatus Wallbacteria bacterium]